MGNGAARARPSLPIRPGIGPARWRRRWDGRSAPHAGAGVGGDDLEVLRCKRLVDVAPNLARDALHRLQLVHDPAAGRVLVSVQRRNRTLWSRTRPRWRKAERNSYGARPSVNLGRENMQPPRTGRRVVACRRRWARKADTATSAEELARRSVRSAFAEGPQSSRLAEHLAARAQHRRSRAAVHTGPVDVPLRDGEFMALHIGCYRRRTFPFGPVGWGRRTRRSQVRRGHARRSL